ncbi:hypothetical protein ACWGJ9_08860 [Curtobacterium citreum]
MSHEKVTVLVPVDRLPEFYGRFGDFMLERPPAVSVAEPTTSLHQVGTPPAWADEPGAVDVARKFWHDVTDPGRDLLRVLISGAERERAEVYTPTELVEATGARSTQAVAGIFGGIGRVIADHGLPTYDYAPGKRWHFVWDWDPKKRTYSMAPGMAAVLREVGA